MVEPSQSEVDAAVDVVFAHPKNQDEISRVTLNSPLCRLSSGTTVDSEKLFENLPPSDGSSRLARYANDMLKDRFKNIATNAVLYEKLSRSLSRPDILARFHKNRWPLALEPEIAFAETADSEKTKLWARSFFGLPVRLVTSIVDAYTPTYIKDAKKVGPWKHDKLKEKEKHMANKERPVKDVDKTSTMSGPSAVLARSDASFPLPKQAEKLWKYKALQSYDNAHQLESNDERRTGVKWKGKGKGRADDVADDEWFAEASYGSEDAQFVAATMEDLGRLKAIRQVGIATEKEAALERGETAVGPDTTRRSPPTRASSSKRARYGEFL